MPVEIPPEELLEVLKCDHCGYKASSKTSLKNYRGPAKYLAICVHYLLLKIFFFTIKTLTRGGDCFSSNNL